ncbi:MAG: rhodanese-like domain-containing protein, partial [Bacteroidota bacterium]
AGKETDRIASITVEALEQQIANDTLDGQILDVRKPTEFLSQQLVAAQNFPLDYINHNMNRLERDQRYILHCAGGYRSVIAASILQARGYRNLIDVKRGWNAIKDSNIPKTDYVCPTTLSQDKVDAAVEAVL